MRALAEGISPKLLLAEPMPFLGINLMVEECLWRLKALLDSFIFHILEADLFPQGQKEWALQMQSLKRYQPIQTCVFKHNKILKDFKFTANDRSALTSQERKLSWEHSHFH